MINYDETYESDGGTEPSYQDSNGNYRYARGTYTSGRRSVEGNIPYDLGDVIDRIDNDGVDDNNQYTYFEYSSIFLQAGGLGGSDFNNALKTDYYGFSNYHDNIQPYIVVYMWERTA